MKTKKNGIVILHKNLKGKGYYGYRLISGCEIPVGDPVWPESRSYWRYYCKCMGYALREG
jgi:hypothetical protein